MSDVIKHLDLSSADGAQLNMDALYQIMPSAFTEVRDEKTGEVTRKVNFEVLRQLLGDNATDGVEDGAIALLWSIGILNVLRDGFLSNRSIFLVVSNFSFF